MKHLLRRNIQIQMKPGAIVRAAMPRCQKLAADYEGTDIGKRYAEILQKVADGTWDVTDHMKGMGTEAQTLQTIFSNLKDLFSSLLDVFNKFNDNNSNDLKIYGDAMTEEIDKPHRSVHEYLLPR